MSAPVSEETKLREVYWLRALMQAYADITGRPLDTLRSWARDRRFRIVRNGKTYAASYDASEVEDMTFVKGKLRQIIFEVERK